MTKRTQQDVEWELAEGNIASRGKLADVVMLLMTGGKERTVEEYRQLPGRAGFHLNQAIATSADLSIIEALPGQVRRKQTVFVDEVGRLTGPFLHCA